MENQRGWLIQDSGEGLITQDDIRSFKAELQERCILTEDGVDVLRWGYTQKATFSVKEVYDN